MKIVSIFIYVLKLLKIRFPSYKTRKTFIQSLYNLPQLFWNRETIKRWRPLFEAGN